MDLVLGLSMTSSSVRWVLVDGVTGEESSTVDRGTLPVHDGVEVDALLDAVLARSAPRTVDAIGLTWTTEAERTANSVWQALTDRGIENVIAVSDVEAAEALACGIAHIAGCERLVVCIAETGTSVVAAVTPDGVTSDRVAPHALADVEGFAPDAVFVLGSGDVAAVVSELEQCLQVPVVSATDADLALARGAALASAFAVSLLDAQAAPVRRSLSPTATLASVLAAAVVTFVVSLSVALGMTLTPDAPAPQMARSVTEPAPEPVATPRPVKAAPPEAPKVAPPPPPPMAEPVANEIPAPQAVEMPLPEAPPVYNEPLAPAPALPPAPAYVPPPPPANYLPPAPAAPAYVPPANVAPAQVPGAVPQIPQQPRLRDRIIERIPIINRFHEPEYGQ